MVHCAGDTNLQSLENEIRKILEKRLREMSVPAVIYGDSGNTGALKLLLTGIKSGGKYYTYATLQLHQRAYLAASHNFMDCQTWDAWKMGVFNEKEILDEADDLAREFANDFISANLF
ncbi:hypothetical protein AGMMS49938_10520 [Fibrobacterales bacterium]|nr:hypothetical protein AGMMS49938_10520 [Fibrobacterales bacterium]